MAFNNILDLYSLFKNQYSNSPLIFTTKSLKDNGQCLHPHLCADSRSHPLALFQNS